jgi:hypothetical protein
MRALLSVIPLCLLILLYCKKRGIKAFLLFLTVFFLPFRTDFLLHGGALGESNWTDGIYLSFSDVSLLLLFTYLLISNQKIRRSAIADRIPILAFITACTLSVINSTWRMASIYQIAMLSIAAFLFYFVLTNSLTTPEDVDIILVAFMTSLIFQSSLAILQFVTARQLDYFSTGQGPWGGGPNLWGRGFGTNIDRPNGFAALISPVLFLSVSVLFGTKMHRKLGLMVSFSRGAWIGFFVGLVVLLILFYREGLFTTVRPWKIVALGGLLLALLFPYLKARVVNDFGNSATISRIPLMIAAIRMAKTHPLLGAGVNTFRSIMKSFIAGLEIFYFDEVHNQYLLVLAETGVVGLLSWIWTMSRVIKNSIACFREGQDALMRFVGLGILSGFLASSVHMLFDMFNSKALLSNMFVLLSLAVTCKALSRNEHPAIKLGSIQDSAVHL